MICGVFSIFSDLSFEDILNDVSVQAQNIAQNIRGNVAAQFYICHIILFIIVILLVYFGEVDTTLQDNQDFEDFKDLLKREGLEWSDLFSRPKDKN